MVMVVVGGMNTRIRCFSLSMSRSNGKNAVLTEKKGGIDVVYRWWIPAHHVCTKEVAMAMTTYVHLAYLGAVPQLSLCTISPRKYLHSGGWGERGRGRGDVQRRKR
jgi:hypothetical protein